MTNLTALTTNVSNATFPLTGAYMPQQLLLNSLNLNYSFSSLENKNFNLIAESRGITPINQQSVKDFLGIKEKNVCKHAPLVVKKEFEKPSSQILDKKDLESILDSHSITLTNHDFLHVMGDIFGKDTQLEGNQQLITLNIINNYFNPSIADTNSPYLDRFKNNVLNPIYDLIFGSGNSDDGFKAVWNKKATTAKYLHYLVNYGDSPSFISYLQKQLEKLEKEDFVFFPFTWKSKFSGESHAIVVEIQKQKNSLFTFRIFNTGSGIQYHPIATMSHRSHQLPLEIIDIEPKRMLSTLTLKSFSEIGSLSQIEKPEDSWDPEDLYKVWLPILGGKKNINPKAELSQAQYSGTCSCASLIAYIQNYIKPSGQFARVYFEIQLKTLWNFYKQNKSNLITNEMTRRLLEKGLTFFSKRVLNAYEKGLINNKELLYTDEKLSEIKKTLDQVKFDLNANLKAEGLGPSLEEKSPLVTTTPIALPPSNDHLSFIKPYHSTSMFFDYKPNFKTLNSDLETFTSYFEVLLRKKDTQAIINGYKTLIFKLPLNQKEWSNISLETIKKLNHLSNIFTRSYLLHVTQNGSLEKSLPPELFLAQLKVLTIADIAFSNYCKQNNLKEVMLYSVIFSGILHERSHFFTSISPKLQSEFISISNYLKEKENRLKIECDSTGSSIEDYPSFFKTYFPTADIWRNTNSDQINLPNYDGPESGFFNWDLINSEKFREKMKSKVLDFSSLNDGEQKAAIFSDNVIDEKGKAVQQYNRHLPPIFYEVRDIFYLTDFLIHEPLVGETSQLIEDSSIDYSFHREESQFYKRKNGFSQIPRFFGLKYNYERARKYEDKDIPLHEKTIRLPYTYHFKYYFPKFSSKDFLESYLYPIPFEKHYSSSYFIQYNGRGRSRKASREITHKIRELFLFKDQQITNIISFFSENLHLLSQSDYQNLLQLFLFDFGKIYNELKIDLSHSSQLLSKLGNLLQKSILIEASTKNHSSLLNLLFFNEKVLHFVNYFKNNEKDFFIPDDFKTFFLDTNDHLNSILSSLSPTDNDFWHAHQVKLTLFNQLDILSENDVESFLKSVFYASIHLNKSGNNLQRDEKEHTVRKFEKEILSFLSDPIKRDKLLNKLIQSIDPQQKKLTFHLESYPNFSSEDKKYTINPITGQYYKYQESLTPLPDVFINSHLFKLKFKNEKNLLAKQLNINTYEYTDDQSQKYRFFFKASSLVIQKQIEGEWFQLREIFEIAPPLDKESDPTLPLSIRENYLFWVSENKIYAEEKLSHKTTLRITPPTRFSSTQIQKIDPKTLDPVFQLASIEHISNDYKILQALDCSSYRQIWTKPRTFLSHTIPKEVFYPRLRILFKHVKVDSENRLYIKDPKGFYLDIAGSVDTLSNHKSYVVLKNDKGRKKALIVNHALKKIKLHKVSPLLTDTPIDYKEDEKSLEYALVDIDQNKLITSKLNTFSKLIVLKALILEQNYTSALELLNGCNSSSKPFTTKEVALIEEISKLNTFSGDNDPRAIALYLRTNLLLYKNKMDFQSEIEIQLTHLYNQYLDILPYLGKFSLSKEDELLLLEFEMENRLDIKTCARFRELDRGHYEKALSTACSPHSNYSGIVSHPFYVEEYTTSFPDEVDVHKLCETLFDDKKEIDKPTQSLILRPKLKNIFFQLYESIKKGDSLKLFESIFNLPDGSLSNNEQESNAFFQLLTRSRSKHPILSHILRALYQNKDAFPSYKELISNLDLETIKKKEKLSTKDAQNLIKKFFNEKVLNPTKSLLEKTPKLDSKLDLYSGSQIAFTPPLNEPIQVDKNLQIFQSEFSPDHSQIIDPLSTSPLVSNLDEYLLLTPLRSSIKESSIKKIDFESDNSLILSEKETLLKLLSQENIESYVEFKDISKIIELKNKLESDTKNLNKGLAFYELELLKLANKKSSDSRLGAMNDLKMISGHNREITLKDLKWFYPSQNYLYLKRLNPELSEKDLQILREKTTDYLILSIEHTLKKTLLSLIQEIENARDHPDDELKILAKKFLKLGSLQRRYAILENPEYLVFEDALGVMLYSQQIESLEKLKKGIHTGNGALIEQIMGSGKTFALFPLFTHFNANGNKLSMGVIPEALFPSMSLELQQNLGDAFDDIIQVFNIKRDTKLEVRKLKWIHHRLKSAIKYKKLLLMTSSSFQSLYLKFIETLHNYKSQSELTKIKYYRKIFSLFKEHGSALIDEIDTVLNPKHEHHYTIGMPKEMDFNLINVTEAVYEKLLSYPDINKINNKENYHALVKPFIIENFDLKVIPKLKEFLNQNISYEEKIKKYLLNTHDDKIYEFISSIKDQTILDSLALVKELLNILIPLTYFKNVDEHFGFSKDSTNLLAIPYHGSNNPIEGSSFGTHFETINYTFQLYLEKGIPIDKLEKVIKKLQKKAVEELQNKPSLGFENTNAASEYKLLTKHIKNPPHLFDITNNLKKFHSKINNESASIFYYVKTYVLPTLKIYPKHIFSTPEVYSFLLKEMQGFTGTLWNPDIYPKSMSFNYDHKSTASMLQNIWENSSELVGAFSLGKDLNSTVQNLLSSSNDLSKTQAIIDIGAVFKGIPNKEVAIAILNSPALSKRQNKIDAVIFYDENDRLALLTRENGSYKELPYTEKNIFSLKKIFTFYDQKHTTGSDIKQALDAEGIVTLGNKTILRDLLQSAGRLRELSFGQKISIAIPENTATYLKSILQQQTNISTSTSFNLKDVLQFLMINQAEQRGSDNVKALKSQLRALIEKEIIQKFLDPKISDEEVVQLFKSVEDFFVKIDRINPYELFSTKEKKVNSKEVMEKHINDLLRKTSYPSLNNKMTNLLTHRLNALPKTLSLKTNYGYNKELEKKQEKEIEVELDSEIHKQNKNDDYCLGIREPEIYKILDDIITLAGDKKSTPYLFQKLHDEDSQHEGKHQIATKSFSENIFTVEYVYDTQDPCRIVVNDFLIIEDTKNNSLKILLVGPKNSERIYQNKLEESKVIDTLNAKTFTQYVDSKYPNKRVSLYRIGYGIRTSNFKGMDQANHLKLDNMLEHNDEFMNLLVQVKFFNGALNYSSKEKAFLKDWLRKNDYEKMYSYFKDSILPYLDDSVKKFPLSKLYQVFIELKRETVLPME